MRVPEVLLSGNHAAIAQWRAEQARRRTAERRPDLWARWLREHPGAGSPADSEARPPDASGSARANPGDTGENTR
jgi:tRNA G37 N-methylase TrmD